MGWTSKEVEYYKNGAINTKKEIENILTWKEEKTEKNVSVLKLAIKKGVCYAAVEITTPTSREVIGTVVLYSTSLIYGRRWFDYKIINESCMPYYFNCPNSILDVLTPTEDEHSNEWRERCKNNNNVPELKDLPIGTKIKWNDKILIKMAPSYQFKTDWWCTEDGLGYVSKKRITEYEVI